MDIIELLKSAFLGLVEGITEWLPISSTGHMILVDEFVHLNVTEEFWNMFLVVIQLGAILAVCVLFLRDLLPFGFGKTRVERRNTWSLWGKIVLGCIPAAVIGILFDDFMEEHLYSSTVVAAALIVYGIVQCTDDRGCMGTGHVTDAQTDDVSLGVCLLERRYLVCDGGKQIALGQVFIVSVNLHGFDFSSQRLR